VDPIGFQWMAPEWTAALIRVTVLLSVTFPDTERGFEDIARTVGRQRADRGQTGQTEGRQRADRADRGQTEPTLH
jgi:hypothetical protein